MSLPPFLAAQAAFRDGVPLSANPHDENEPFTPDQYPGAHASWKAGWKFEYRLMMHTKKMKRKTA